MVKLPIKDLQTVYSRYAEALEPSHTIFKKYPVDEEGISMETKMTELPQLVRTSRGEIWAQYKRGERILLEQDIPFLKFPSEVKINPNDFKGYSREQLIELGEARGEITQMTGETQASFEGRLASLGRATIVEFPGELKSAEEIKEVISQGKTTIEGTEYTKEQLFRLGVAGGVRRTEEERETTPSFRERAIGRGMLVAEDQPESAKAFTGRGVYVSRETEEELMYREEAGDIEAQKELERISGIVSFKKEEPTFVERIEERLEETRAGRTLLFAIKGADTFDIATGQIVSIEEMKRRETARQKAAEEVKGVIGLAFETPLEFQRTDIGERISDITEGIVGQVLTLPIREPEKTQALLATGTILPKAMIGLEKGLASFFGGGATGITTARGILGVGTGVLAGKFILDTAEEVRKAETDIAKGEAIGQSIGEVALLGGVRARPIVPIKKMFPEFKEREFMRDMLTAQQKQLLKKGFLFEDISRKQTTFAQRFAGEKPIVFQDKQIIGDQLKLIKQAKAQVPKPIEFEIKPTLEQQQQITRLMKGLDIFVFKEGVMTMVEKKPRFKLKKEKVIFDIKPTIEEQQQILRLKKELDILEGITIREGIKFKIREAPAPEVLKALERKPIEFDIKPEVIKDIDWKLRQQQLRLEKGLAILERTQEGFIIREAEKPEVLKLLEPKPFEFETKITPEQQKQLVRLKKDLDILEAVSDREGIRFKIREAPKPEVLTTRAEQEIKFIEQARARLPEIKKITEIKPSKPFEIIKIEKIKPLEVERIVSGQQQRLVQIMKEPKVKPIKPLKVSGIILEDIRVAKLFPGFIIPTTKFGAPIGRIPKFEELGKIKDLGVFEGRIPIEFLKPIQIEKLKPRIKLKPPKEILVESQRELLKNLQKTIQLQEVRQRQFFVFPLRVKTKLKQKQKLSQILKQPQLQRLVSASAQTFGRQQFQQQTFKERNIQKLITKLVPPLEPPPTAIMFPFKLKGKREKKRREKLWGKEDAAFIEGFVARQLQLDPRIIKATDIEKELKKLDRVVGIRRAPIIVR